MQMVEAVPYSPLRRTRGGVFMLAFSFGALRWGLQRCLLSSGWLSGLPIVRHQYTPPLRSSADEAEDARLERMGLATLRDGSFLKEHPFEPPWTSHSLLIPSTWTEPGVGIKGLLGSRQVRADRLLADLDVLQPVMARAWIRGWSWERWFGDWRSRLAARRRGWMRRSAPMDQLLAFQRDNHAQIPLNRGTSDSTADGRACSCANCCLYGDTRQRQSLFHRRQRCRAECAHSATVDEWRKQDRLQ